MSNLHHGIHGLCFFYRLKFHHLLTLESWMIWAFVAKTMLNNKVNLFQNEIIYSSYLGLYTTLNTIQDDTGSSVSRSWIATKKSWT